MNLGLHIMKNPAGTYSFVGSVPIRLGWINKDGSMLSDIECKELARACIPSMHGRCRVFKTVEDAFQAARVEGIDTKTIK